MKPTPTKSTHKRFGLSLDADTRHAVKIAAAKADQSMNQWLREAIVEKLKGASK